MKKVIGIAGLITLATLATWRITGGDAYTKYQINVVEERKLDESDPLYGTGFYENDIVKETVTRNEFRLGLLPTPEGLFDKHIISVLTILGPVWGFALLYWLIQRRKRKPSKSAPRENRVNTSTV